MTKQMTIVVIGSLRTKSAHYLELYSIILYLISLQFGWSGSTLSTYALDDHFTLTSKKKKKHLMTGLKVNGYTFREGNSVKIHFAPFWNWVYEGPAKRFVTGFGLLQCYILSNIFLLQTFKVFPLYWNTFL